MIIRFETELAFCQLLEWLIKVNKQAEEAERKKKIVCADVVTGSNPVLTTKN